MKHQKKNIETFEEKVNCFRKDKTRFLPNPEYVFSVGEQVELGRLEDVFIEYVFDDGMFYLIDFTSTDNNYGKPISTYHNKRLVTYLEIRPITKKEIGLIENQDIFLHYSMSCLAEILSKKYFFGLEMNPSYQRGYVWEHADKVFLIDSIFKSVDIGKFVFVQREYDEQYLYEILDGKQRVSAICEFYENKFSWNGYYFNDLGTRERNHFEDYPVSIATVERVSEHQKLRFFLNLNRSGKVMSKEHLDKIERMLTQ